MSLEDSLNTLLDVTGITTLCGENVANTQLPQITDPTTRDQSIVYTVLNVLDVLPVAAIGPYIKQARVQFDCSGRTPAKARAVREALKAAIRFQRGVVAGTTIVSVEPAGEGPHAKNEEAMIFTIPVDYKVTFYDA
jgi:hypothetical protein